MSVMRHVSHIKSSGTTAPLLGDFGYYGEIVVNYRKDSEKLYIKNSENEVIPFATESQAFEEAKAYIDSKKIVVSDGLIGGDYLSAATITVKHDVVGPVVSTIKGSDNKTLDRGDSFNVPTVSYDRFGHIVSGSVTTFTLNSNLGYISGVTNTDEIRLEVSDGRILKAIHSGHTSGGSAQGSTGDTVITDTGKTAFNMPVVYFNQYGHVTGTGITAVSLTVPAAATNHKGIVQLASERGDSTTLVMTQKAVTDAIRDSFTEQAAMRYRGTVANANEFTTKGASHVVGDTYIATASFEISASGTAMKIDRGDMLIANTSGSTFNLTHWDCIQANMDPDLYVLKVTKVIAGDRVRVNGTLTSTTLSGDVTINHETIFANSGVTLPNAAQTPDFGQTANVSVIDYDKWGHITGTTTTTIKIPDFVAISGSTGRNGLMTKEDKGKLDHIATGSTKVEISNQKTTGDTKLFDLKITDFSGGTINTSVYSDNQIFTFKAGSGSTITTVAEYRPSTAKTVTIKGDDDMIFITGDTGGNITVRGGNVICGDY